MKFRGVLGRLSLALLLAGAAGAAACRPYVVVQQSTSPPALRGVQHVTVSYDWSQVRIDGEPEGVYVAEKSAEERADFEVLKAETDGAILAALREEVGAPYTFTVHSGPPQIGELRVVVQHADFQPGVFTYVYNRPTRVLTRFIWIRDGRTTDIIDADTSVAPKLGATSDHQRVVVAGRNLGRAAAEYFIEAQHLK